jgi:hypothetical protein
VCQGLEGECDRIALGIDDRLLPVEVASDDVGLRGLDRHKGNATRASGGWRRHYIEARAGLFRPGSMKDPSIPTWVEHSLGLFAVGGWCLVAWIIAVWRVANRKFMGPHKAVMISGSIALRMSRRS